MPYKGRHMNKSAIGIPALAALMMFFGFYAEDAILWFPEGRTDVPAYKKEWTEYIKGGAALEQAKLSDLHIRVSPAGDTAIASYQLHVKTRAADKSVTEEDFQETDVWFETAA